MIKKTISNLIVCLLFCLITNSSIGFEDNLKSFRTNTSTEINPKNRIIKSEVLFIEITGSAEICIDDKLTEQQLFSVLDTSQLTNLDNGNWKNENDNSFSFPVGVGIYTYTDNDNNTAEVTVTQKTTLTPEAGEDREHFLTWGETYNLNTILEETESNNTPSIHIQNWIFESTTGPVAAEVTQEADIDFPNTGAGSEVLFIFTYTVVNQCGETDDAQITFYLNDSNLWTRNAIICDGEKLTKQNLFDSAYDPDGRNESQIKYFDGEWKDINGNPVSFPVGEGMYSYTNLTSNLYDFVVTKTSNSLNTKVYLQGAMLNPNIGEENLMRDDLRILGLIPTTSPYNDATCDISVFNFTGENAIVDWVLIQFIEYTFLGNFVLLHSKSALLQRDGDVVDIDGFSPLCFSSKTIPSIPTYNSSFHLSIKHRNHLSIMTNSAVIDGEFDNNFVVDFTNFNNPITYGTNGQTSFGIPVDVIAMWAGDADNSDSIRYLGPNNDIIALKNKILEADGNTTNSNFYPAMEYSDADFDMNGIVRYLGPNNDTNILKNIILNHPNNTSSSNFYPVSTQTPNSN